MRVPPVPPGSTPEPRPVRAAGPRPPDPLPDDAPSPSDMVVLSEAAYRALARARLSGSTQRLDGSYGVPALGSEVYVHVRPTAEPGTVTVSAAIVDRHDPVRALRLEATVRESWLERAQRGSASDEERARRTVEALAELAAVPGQQTVQVSAPELPRLEPPIRGPVPPVTGAWLPAEYPPEMLLPAPFGTAE